MTIYSFIVRLLWSCGIWFLVYLEFVGLCQCLLLSFLLASKVDLVTIAMEIYGWLFLIVWCGVFGRKEVVASRCFEDNEHSMPDLKFLFFRTFWTGSQCGETNLFLLFWIYLIYVIFVFDMYSLIYFLCTWVSLSFWNQLINKSLLLIKKKKKIQLSNESTIDPKFIRLVVYCESVLGFDK